MYTVFGKRWFDKINGNTYHSVVIYKGNKFLAKNEFSYGYDEAYKQTAREIFIEKGIVINYQWVDTREWENKNVLFLVCDVNRRKDL